MNSCLGNIYELLISKHTVNDAIGDIVNVHRHAQPLEVQDVHALEEFGPDMEWTDGADDKLAVGVGESEFGAQRFREADDGELGGAVVGEFVAAGEAAHAGYVDDVALVVLEHGRQELAAKPEVGQSVDSSAEKGQVISGVKCLVFNHLLSSGAERGQKKRT